MSTAPQAAPTLEILTHLVGVPRSARPIRYRRLGDGTWVSDAVVAARHGAAGGTIYPCALRFAAHEEMAGPLLAGPEALDRFRGLQAELLGWADRPEIGFRGDVLTDAARANCDPDLVSAPPDGDLEVAPMHATDQPVHRDQVFQPGTPDEPLLVRGPNYFYYGTAADDRTGRPLERGDDEAWHPIPGVRAVWVVQRLTPGLREAAEELAALSREITDLVLSHEEPLPDPDAITGGSRLRPRRPQRIPSVRLAAWRIAPGFWGIREFDYNRWQGTVGREPLDTHALVEVLTGQRVPGELAAAATAMAARATDAPTNTRLVYRYRDASNYKGEMVVVLPGALTPDEIALLRHWCAAAARGAGVDPEAFLPTQLGLRPAQYALWADAGAGDDDHVWNELVSIEPTDQPADADAPAALAVLGGFAAAAREGWAVTDALDELGLDRA